jgi:drug/metabolite transporter (DMT)-like permease
VPLRSIWREIRINDSDPGEDAEAAAHPVHRQSMMPLRQRIRGMIWLPTESDDSPGRLQPRAVYPLLAFVIFALGVNWPVMAIALRSMPPIWLAASRLIAAAVTLFLLTSLTGRLSLPPRQDLSMVLSIAALRLAAVFVLVFFALEIVPPGRSSILVWTASLWTVPIAVTFIGEQMSRTRWIGLTAGIVGILFVFEPTRLDWSDGRVILGHAMLLGAAMAQASVSVHVRHHSWESTPLGLLPWQLLVASTAVVVIALATHGIPTVDWSLGLVANLMFQGVVVSGFALWGQLTVLRSHPAISTNLALMLVPVVGLLSSVLLVDETLNAGVLAGLTLVLIGVVISRVGDPMS